VRATLYPLHPFAHGSSVWIGEHSARDRQWGGGAAAQTGIGFSPALFGKRRLLQRGGGLQNGFRVLPAARTVRAMSGLNGQVLRARRGALNARRWLLRRNPRAKHFSSPPAQQHDQRTNTTTTNE